MNKNCGQNSRSATMAIQGCMRSTPVVEAADGSIRPGQGRDDEAHTGRQLAEMMHDLHDHPLGAVSGRSLVLDAPVAHQWGVAGSAPGIGADDDGLLPSPAPVNDGKEHMVPPVRTVNVAWPELGSEAVTVLVEDEQGMVAGPS